MQSAARSGRDLTRFLTRRVVWESIMDVVVALLKYYSFEFGDRSLNELIKDWSKYTPNWVRLAIVECLYQGRYKVRSVDQILKLWQRRGNTSCHFNHEFERLVCGDFVYSVPGVAKKSRAKATPGTQRTIKRSSSSSNSSNSSKTAAASTQSSKSTASKTKLGTTYSAQTAKLAQLAKQGRAAKTANQAPIAKNRATESLEQKSEASLENLEPPPASDNSTNPQTKQTKQIKSASDASATPRSKKPSGQSSQVTDSRTTSKSSQKSSQRPKASSASAASATTSAKSAKAKSSSSQAGSTKQSKSTSGSNSSAVGNKGDRSGKIAQQSAAYRSARRNMELLAESSLFVDKLKSMCGEAELDPALTDTHDTHSDTLSQSPKQAAELEKPAKTGHEATVVEEVIAESTE
ncbi:hypothetical protein [Thalassoporum mexicanum]|uniref:hypothetical protein n=1 Tax=Thalassoporum mexicanum TaxID=3457544 RepID=UPI0012EAF4B9|nr:hypothetical protein [Pseudanabaena sp. PCC 7367]